MSLLVIHSIVSFLKSLALQIYQEAIRIALVQSPKLSTNLIDKKFKENF